MGGVAPPASLVTSDHGAVSLLEVIGHVWCMPDEAIQTQGQVQLIRLPSREHVNFVPLELCACLAGEKGKQAPHCSMASNGVGISEVLALLQNFYIHSLWVAWYPSKLTRYLGNKWGILYFNFVTLLN